MILLASNRLVLAQLIKENLKKYDINVDLRALNKNSDLDTLYDKKYKAIIIESSFANLPKESIIDILNGLGSRVPVILIDDENFPQKTSEFHQANDKITIISPDNSTEIVATIESFLGINPASTRTPLSIPYYNPHIPYSMLNKYGGIGILSIDISSFNNFALEYGNDVYNTMRNAFRNTLHNMWGTSGCFRNTDVVCHKSSASSIYYIFMNPTKTEQSAPLPSDLEKVSNRLGHMLQKNMWQELFESGKKKEIPENVKTAPLVGIGSCGILKNPCIGTTELVEHALDTCQRLAKDNLKHLKNRQKEFIQTLIQTPDILVPHYQGIFNLKNITEEITKELNSDNNLTILKDHIFGFESLIRVNQDVAGAYIDTASVLGIDSRCLRPEILFSMAKENNISLELDQACLNLAGKYGSDLIGQLMINILPRNLYYIEKLVPQLPRKQNIIFEVSESEAIHNFSLLMKSCEFLSKLNIKIAADDFGRGFSSLDRIIRMHPKIIKFDRTIIQNVHLEPVKQAYLEGMIKSGRRLNAVLLAEGVESWEEARILKKMGVELIQGFLFHKPQSIETINEQLYKDPLDTVA